MTRPATSHATITSTAPTTLFLHLQPTTPTTMYLIQPAAPIPTPTPIPARQLRPLLQPTTITTIYLLHLPTTNYTKLGFSLTPTATPAAKTEQPTNLTYQQLQLYAHITHDLHTKSAVAAPTPAPAPAPASIPSSKPQLQRAL